MEALATAAMMQNVDVSAQVVLSLTGDFQRTTHTYQCEGLEPLAVDFINAEPNFLAIIPIGGKQLVFVNIISGSGARYAAGQYEFWTKGSEATLTDLQADPQTPISCTEATETP
ncbi:MliC family protein [Devosia sp. CN2-171]|jgi:membrane-bound inhibitor of C-type lysozyme|uniref:MliC family protein n=1 Tax=Devosia sp. CN2-171 TaxID=3400909 RepID=UPI003BF908A7